MPYQKADAAAHGRPRGNLSDLYPRWLGARELLLHHRDPYSPEVTREIQAGYYGRVLDPDRADDPKDQQGFAYPVYVVFLLAPTIGLPFPVVQTGFRWLLVVLTLLSVPLWLRAVRWRPSARGACDPDHPDLWQFCGGAGNQAAAVDSAGGCAAGRLRRSPRRREFRARWLSARPGDHQAATGSAAGGVARVVGDQRLASARTLGLPLEPGGDSRECSSPLPNTFCRDGWAAFATP